MKHYLVIAFALLSFMSSAQTLKEKQAIANLDFSWAEKRVLENYGSKVKIELDRASFAGDVEAIEYADSRGAVMIANAIAKICGYPVGKEALTDQKVVTVVLKNIKQGNPKVEIANGVLTLYNGFSSAENFFGESELKEAIEGLL